MQVGAGALCLLKLHIFAVFFPQYRLFKKHRAIPERLLALRVLKSCGAGGYLSKEEKHWRGRLKGMAIRLITDSAADYENEEKAEKNLIVIPFSISFGNETYLDGVDLDKDTFYSLLLKKKHPPTTSQPPPGIFLREFLKAKENGDSVIAILISGGLSGALQSARVALEMAEYEHIHIIDSLSAATGLRILVDEAHKMRLSGMSAQEITAEIECLKKRVRVFAVVNTLEYLQKGGRLNRVQAKIGGMVGLKPIISMDQENGRVVLLDKCLGLNRAFKRLLSIIREMPFDDKYPFHFPYTFNTENAVNLFAFLKESYPDLKKNIYNVGPGIGSHVGDKAFGISYVARIKQSP
jgi:DegV family protein with EDD domain